VTRTREEYVLWDASTWQAQVRWPADRNQAGGVAGAFSRDNKFYATADLTGRVTIRSLPEARRSITLPPPQPMRVRDLVFGAAGDRLYLMRLDGRVYEWDLDRLRAELAKLQLDWIDTSSPR